MDKGKQQMNSTCQQCGDDNDLLTAFTQNKICGKCTKKNQKKATK
jgi:ribosomal protein S27AE